MVTWSLGLRRGTREDFKKSRHLYILLSYHYLIIDKQHSSYRVCNAFVMHAWCNGWEGVVEPRQQVEFRERAKDPAV